MRPAGARVRAARARVDDFLSNREAPCDSDCNGRGEEATRAPEGFRWTARGPAAEPVTATFTDAELAQLERLAASENIPLGTMLNLLTKISLGR